MEEGHLHTVVIWQSGFMHLSEIIYELSDKFEIKYAKKIIWDKDEVPKKLTTLYMNRVFDMTHSKIKSIGGNELIVLVVLDKKSILENDVNLNMLNYKKQKRKKGENYIHISDNHKEGYYNFRAIFPISEDNYFSFRDKKTIKITSLKNDILEIENI